MLFFTFCSNTTGLPTMESRATIKAALLFGNLRVMRYLDDGGEGRREGGHWGGMIAILISYYSRFPAFI
jgi:hypothetical protein